MLVIDFINNNTYICRHITTNIMELRQLNYFLTLAETLNFSDAASKLFITQGTLSQQIKQLEAEVGTSLFFRTSHSVELTDAGKELLPLVQKTVETSVECKTKMKELTKEVSGTLYIGVTHSFSELIIKTLDIYVRKYPQVKLNIHYSTASELYDMLLEHKLDLILAFKPAVKYEDVESEQLFSCELGAVMNKNNPLAKKERLTLDDLGKCKVILPGSGLQSRKAFERFVDVDTSHLNICAEANDIDIILKALVNTNMVSILSTLAVHLCPSLTAVPIEGIKRVMNGCIHYLKNTYKKRAATEFIKILHDNAAIGRIMMETI